MRGEISFFNFKWRKGVQWYEAQFPRRQENCLIGEKTPSYLYCLSSESVHQSRRFCHERMHTVLPSAKLIVCLRDPLTRAYSHWRMKTRHVENYQRSFDDAIELDLHNMNDPTYVRLSGDDFVQKGFYAEYLKNLHLYYPPNQIHVCITERLWSNLEFEYNRIFEFLGVEPLSRMRYRLTRSNYERDWTERTRTRLSGIYADHIRQLEQLLGFEIPEWTR